MGQSSGEEGVSPLEAGSHLNSSDLSVSRLIQEEKYKEIHDDESQAEQEEEEHAVDEWLKEFDMECALPSQEARTISKHPNHEITESLIAQQLASLSMKDREDVYFDIHGVSAAIDEDSEPDFVDRKLLEMQKELDMINRKEKKAYIKAHKANPRYVLDNNLRLRFLRADRFDAKMAAQRYVNHYEVKVELFGAETLGRDIVQDDLDEESLDALYCPFNQLLPQRDRAGRAVFVFVPNRQQRQYSQKAAFRRAFYNSLVVTEDVETQKNGVVIVFYALSGNSGGGGNGYVNKVWKTGQFFRSVPWRIAAIHFCYSNLTWLPVMSTLRLAADLCCRMRFRAHRGSHLECMYELQTFGIPTNAIPIDANGRVLPNIHKQFLTCRRIYERKRNEIQARMSRTSLSATDHNVVIVPNNYDVLFGRGKGYFNHIGNIRYRSLIDEIKDSYENSQNIVKKRLTMLVIEMIQKSGGRFLKEDVDGSGSWVIVEGAAVRFKVSHSFRAQLAIKGTARMTPSAPCIKSGDKGASSKRTRAA